MSDGPIRPAGGAGGLSGRGALDNASVNRMPSDSSGVARRTPPEKSTATKSTFEAPPKHSSKTGASGQDQQVAKLGAGGTSEAVKTGDNDDVSRIGGGGLGKAAAVGAAIPAAATAGQLMVIMMFMNWLKGLMMNLLAMVGNLWNLAMGLLLSVGKTVMGSVLAVGTAVSTALGGAVSAVAAGAVSFAGGSLVVVIVATSLVSMLGENNAVRDSPLAQCTVKAEAALEEIDGSNGSVDVQTRANAEMIFSVLSAWGMPNENIAGIIGNWDAESGVDPTSVQNHFDSPMRMSDAKRSAASNTDNGIGLGQWTFGRNSNLRAYADGHGKDWWTLEIQLGFMISAAEGSDAGVVKDMIATSYGSPAEAAAHFHEAWERSNDTPAMAARRGTYANMWMGMFSGWTANKTLADSILQQAGTTVSGANDSRAEAVRAECNDVEEAPEWVADGTAPGAWGGFENGKIPQSALAPIPWAQLGPAYLRTDAVEALAALNVEFKAQFGYDLAINDAYRDYAGQVYQRNRWCSMGKCQNAAVPGTSNHGWALAVDIGNKSHTVLSFSSPEYLWLKANAGKYGWVHPKYMEPGGTGPFEAWHWEFYGVVKA